MWLTWTDHGNMCSNQQHLHLNFDGNSFLSSTLTRSRFSLHEGEAVRLHLDCDLKEIIKTLCPTCGDILIS